MSNLKLLRGESNPPFETDEPKREERHKYLIEFNGGSRVYIFSSEMEETEKSFLFSMPSGATRCYYKDNLKSIKRLYTKK